MIHVSDIIPWSVKPFSLRPFRGFYSFNPSIHFDGKIWRCVMRNCDYNARGGNYQVRNGRIITRNVMVVFSDNDLGDFKYYEMRELDNLIRYPTYESGYEDMRLFCTKSDGLVGVATTAQLRVETQQEIVICYFDNEYNIVKTKPLRGEWSGYAQKNWAPYEGLAEIKLLYSIDRGITYPKMIYVPDITIKSSDEVVEYRKHNRGGVDTVVFSKPRANVHVPYVKKHDWTSPGLRGGSQLNNVGDGLWLGIGHEMEFRNKMKYYWHRFYLVNDDGKKVGESDNFKLADCGIEFASGMGLNQDRAVISYGTEDMDSWFGFTSLSAIMETIKPCKI